ncbi:MAG: hypothetical protein Cons2KO_14630 [Congregibacter sp.]
MQIMRRLPRAVLLLVPGLAIAFTSPVFADGLYFGAGVYQTDLEVAAGSDDDFTPAGFVGYQFLDSNLLMLSAELGYYDLGATSGQLDDISFSADASALTLAGVAYLPIGPFFEVYAKAGVAAVDVETRLGDTRRDDDGTELFGGLGVAFDIFDTIDIYAEYLQFDNAFDSQMIGVGIRIDLF